MPASRGDILSGLSAADARARLEGEGFNELPRAGRRSALLVVLEVAKIARRRRLAG